MRNQPPPSLPDHSPIYPPPLILPADRSDIPSVVSITLAAEKSNLMSFLRYPTPQDEIRVRAAMIQLLQRVWDNPQLKIMKAVDRTTGVIMAVSVWTFDGYIVAAEDVSEKFGEWKDLEELRIMAGSVWAASEALQSRNDDDGTWADPLGKFVSEECGKFLQSWAKPTRHMYLGLLMTDPCFQRRGIGTALLNWGHKIADEDGIPSFLVATPVGRPLYASLGWREVDEGLSLDLRDWTWGGKEATRTEDHGYGQYKYYFMMRLPKNAAAKQQL